MNDFTNSLLEAYTRYSEVTTQSDNSLMSEYSMFIHEQFSNPLSLRSHLELALNSDVNINVKKVICCGIYNSIKAIKLNEEKVSIEESVFFDCVNKYFTLLMSFDDLDTCDFLSKISQRFIYISMVLSEHDNNCLMQYIHFISSLMQNESRRFIAINIFCNGFEDFFEDQIPNIADFVYGSLLPCALSFLTSQSEKERISSYDFFKYVLTHDGTQQFFGQYMSLFIENFANAFRSLSSRPNVEFESNKFFDFYSYLFNKSIRGEYECFLLEVDEFLSILMAIPSVLENSDVNIDMRKCISLLLVELFDSDFAKTKFTPDHLLMFFKAAAFTSSELEKSEQGDSFSKFFDIFARNYDSPEMLEIYSQVIDGLCSSDPPAFVTIFHILMAFLPLDSSIFDNFSGLAIELVSSVLFKLNPVDDQYYFNECFIFISRVTENNSAFGSEILGNFEEAFYDLIKVKFDTSELLDCLVSLYDTTKLECSLFSDILPTLFNRMGSESPVIIDKMLSLLCSIMSSTDITIEEKTSVKNMLVTLLSSNYISGSLCLVYTRLIFSDNKMIGDELHQIVEASLNAINLSIVEQHDVGYLHSISNLYLVVTEHMEKFNEQVVQSCQRIIQEYYKVDQDIFDSEIEKVRTYALSSVELIASIFYYFPTQSLLDIINSQFYKLAEYMYDLTSPSTFSSFCDIPICIIRGITAMKSNSCLLLLKLCEFLEHFSLLYEVQNAIFEKFGEAVRYCNIESLLPSDCGHPTLSILESIKSCFNRSEFFYHRNMKQDLAVNILVLLQELIAKLGPHVVNYMELIMDLLTNEIGDHNSFLKHEIASVRVNTSVTLALLFYCHPMKESISGVYRLACEHLVPYLNTNKYEVDDVEISLFGFFFLVYSSPDAIDPQLAKSLYNMCTKRDFVDTFPRSSALLLSALLQTQKFKLNNNIVRIVLDNMPMEPNTPYMNFYLDFLFFLKENNIKLADSHIDKYALYILGSEDWVLSYVKEEVLSVLIQKAKIMSNELGNNISDHISGYPLLLFKRYLSHC